MLSYKEPEKFSAFSGLINLSIITFFFKLASSIKKREAF
ncbi:hypothetical protein AF65_06045 [Streptococcus uberis C5388]|nr:hypothetical protein AF64_05975 [Streptococcus uberis C9359]KKF53471.1 hypothetical protein AF65_06045 [Streptococcus uberis C5388]KKF61652.1 hypothetical protein AF58_08780 [Streptococcus uberis C6344]